MDLESLRSVVTEFKVFNKGLHLEDIQEISFALMHENNCVKKLSLVNDDIDDEKLIPIATALSSAQCKVEDFVLTMNSFGINGTRALASAITSQNCKLHTLDLFSNKLDAECATVLASALISPNNKITNLGLQWNQIGDDGAVAIAHAFISEHCKLASLHLDGNGIGERGAKALITSLLHYNCKIVNIEASRFGNAILPETDRAIVNAVDTARMFRTLIVLLSARAVQRLASNSPVKRLPSDLIRLVSSLLPKISTI